MSASAAPASRIALPAIPAFASGAFSAEDFTSQLESFKTALAATCAGIGDAAPDGQEPQATTVMPGNFKLDSPQRDAAGAGDSTELDSAKDAPPVNVATMVPQLTLRDFTGPLRYTGQPVSTVTEREQPVRASEVNARSQADVYTKPSTVAEDQGAAPVRQSSPTLQGYPTAPHDNQVAIQAKVSRPLETQPQAAWSPTSKRPVVNQNANAGLPIPKDNEHAGQTIHAASPLPVPQAPNSAGDTGAATVTVQTPPTVPSPAMFFTDFSQQTAAAPPVVTRPELVSNYGRARLNGSRAIETAAPLPEFPSKTPAATAIPVTRATQAGPPAPLSFAAKIQAPDSQQDTPQAAKSSPDPKPPHPVNSQNAVISQNAGSTPVMKRAPHDEQAAVSTPNSAPATSAVISAVQPPAAPAPIAPQMEAQTDPVVKETVAKEPAASAAAAPKSNGGQLKELSFNIAQPGGSTVQLRMVEHAGELRVAVHTASPQLNQDLRDDLTDLTKKLSDTGVHSEIWHPDAHGTAAKNQSDSPQNGSQNNPGNPQSQSGGSQQQGRGQREQNQPQRPKWVEELEDGIHSASKTTGETNGLRS